MAYETTSVEQQSGEKGALQDHDLLEECQSRYRRCITYYGPWKKEAQEDYKFALGDQWTDSDKQKLKNQKRPCLTFNRIKPLLNLVSGYQRENAARIKVSPEGGEDKIFSEVIDKGMKAIDKWSKMSYKLGYLFDDGINCGKGHLEGLIDYDKDPIRGELKFKNNGPYRVMVDPDSMEYNFNEDAEYCFKVEKFSKGKLAKMYPDKKSTLSAIKTDEELEEETTLQEGDKDNYGNDVNATTVVTKSDFADDDALLEPDLQLTHKEYWYKKYVTKFFVADDDGDAKKFNTKEEAEGFAQSKQRKVFERKVAEMWVAMVVCGTLMQNSISPLEPNYNGFPFFRYIADWAPSAESELWKVMGITRPLKDPQREKNKAKSAFLHVIATQANSGWVGDRDALSSGGWRELRKMGSSAGIVVKKKKGSELKEIQPKAPQMAQIMRERAADEEFYRISNINPDLLGMQDKTQSGRAIALRIRQAVLALVRMFVNYRYTKEIIGLFILKMMPELFDAKKLSKVLGQKYMRENKLDEGVLAGYLTMIKDQKYDVSVTESDQASTTRAEIFEQLVEMGKAGIPVPPDLFVEYMDVQNSTEIKGRLQQFAQQQQAAEAQK